MVSSARDGINTASAAEPDYKRVWGMKGPHFNHGSYGFTPLAVQEHQAALQREYNADREGFIWGTGQEKLAAVRERVADFVGADAGNLVLTDNSTASFNTVLKSVDLGPGDELLVTDHVYGPFKPVLQEEAARRGFKIVVAKVPYPPESNEQVVDSIVDAATENTKLALIDHIASPTALVFPVKEIVAALDERGIDTLVDGAHAPGQLALDMNDIGAAYYTGSFHKWTGAPSTSAFLHVRPDRQDRIMPLAGGVGATREADFVKRFSWTGSREPCAMLALPGTFDYMASLHPEGWQGIRERNHGMAVTARDLICQRLGCEVPYDDGMTGSMFTVPLGKLDVDGPEGKSLFMRCQDWGQEKHGFGIFVSSFGDQQLLRVCCHLHTTEKDAALLADAVCDLVDRYGVKSQPEARRAPEVS